MESIIQYNTLKRILKKVRFSIKLLLDRKYWTVDIYGWLKIIDNWKKNKYNYIADRFDCDDFALLMAGLVAYTCYKSGFKKQLAFGIAWSNIHAYNLYVDKNLTVWVWEPQTASIIGKAIDYKNDQTYGIKYVWFMG